MSKIEIASKYSHKEIESKWIQIYEDTKSFHPLNALKTQSNDTKNTESYSIVIPPPNVTGELHVGHALNQTIQDVLIRNARKEGKNTLWIPGTDHAGIATQVRVEKELKKKNLDRHKIGRKAFLKSVWEWKEKYGSRITDQQRLMGFSLDWSREAFTMSESLSKAVRQVFVDLYKKSYIYRDTSIVHWDPISLTVLSSLEIEHEDDYMGFLYSFAYPLAEVYDNTKEIVVATTRPETMLGDTAVAVHPTDKRYKKLIGKKLIHPLLGHEIPIIADKELVDPKFGTGAVKITPAHDLRDFEVGKRHHLKMINIFDEKAQINENGGKYKGLDRFKARQKIKEDLIELGLFRGETEHRMSIARSQRSGAIVEPLVSTQWFVKTKALAEESIKVVEEGQIRFFPKRWENTYFHWMKGIHDWCISRQLWWGHQIPAWYGPDGHIFVATSLEEAQKEASLHYKTQDIELRQEEDVLDTWFSSALWPFSTLNWESKQEEGEDFKTYFPTNVLVTGFDIIFFWVARMIMMSLFCTNKIPFKDVYIHNLMRDEWGKKMSKTKGNVIDPIESIQKHGADAFRFFLLATLNETKDSIYSEQSLKGYQNFMNKIWNANRLLCMHLPENFQALDENDVLKSLHLEAEDCWIVSSFIHLVESSKKNLEQYKFQIYARSLYAFVWHEYCDWYLECIKPRLFGKLGEELAESARQVAFFILEGILHYLHPSIPFITEELYSHLSQYKKNKKESSNLCTLAYPQIPKLNLQQKEDAYNFQIIQEIIATIRSTRANLSLSPPYHSKSLLLIDEISLKKLIEKKETIFCRLAKLNHLEWAHTKPEQKILLEKIKKEKCISQALTKVQIYISIGDLLDFENERKVQQSKYQNLETQIHSLKKKLENTAFIEKAPNKVIEKEKEKLINLEEQREQIQSIVDLYEKMLA